MIFEFPEILACPTPESWLGKVNPNIETLLIDHALCEKKAALSAISMLYSYAKYDKIIEHMPKLAREELKHFENRNFLSSLKLFQFLENLSFLEFVSIF